MSLLVDTSVWSMALRRDSPADLLEVRALADALEAGDKFEIQIAGERIYVPVRAEYNIEHEREGKDEEIEFQIKWTNE